ncbi:hypothetical protein GA0004736_2363 [Curtobacterium sp. 9128]|uniref:hypothetical protein n=1 Tax=Curtobacterium sp. 9128 TaxID=1793722 RepID=UPI0007D73562|nr:hypothetical protein [Curtobacterium sp. 9128]SBN63430.1 hypothetical protein GA0004736_2363 [Curtobacterium sp. 9128]
MNVPVDDEIAALRAENERLRAALDETLAGRHDQGRRGFGWVIPSAALIVIGAILAPVVVVTTWASRETSSTAAFVETFSPLARDPAVQSFITAKTNDVVDEHLDVRQLTGTVFDGLRQLDLPPRAASALTALEAPASTGVENLVHQTVQRFVASDAFTTLWDGALRTGHAQLVRSLTGDQRAAVAIAADGSIGIQLGPIVAEVKQRLIDQGLGFASRIPVVDRTVVIATSDAAVRAETAYALVQVTAAWLPWLAVACIGIGVVMARRRARALSLAGIGVAIAMAVTMLGLAFGRVVTVRALAPDLMPRNAARVIYDTVVAFVLSASVAITVLALAVAVTAWFAGSSRPAVRLRAGWGRLTAGARRAAEVRGVTTGRVGVELDRFRVPLLVLVAVVAAAVIALHRPLSPGLIVWTLVSSLVAVGIVDLLARPASTDGRPGQASRDGDDGVSPDRDDQLATNRG